MRSSAAFLLLVGACAAPVQNGGVEVAPGAADRLAVTCRWRHGNVGRDGCAAPEAKGKASVHRLERSTVRGALAIGRPGDLVLENDEVLFVIDQLGRGTGFAESGGNIVDAADAHVLADELGQVFTYFGQFPRQAIYDHLETGVDPDGAAFVDVSGHELYETKLLVKTRYALAPGARALAIATELTNAGDAPLAPIELGDAVQWGSTVKVARNHAPGFSGNYGSTHPIGGIGKTVSYAMVPTAIACEGCAKEPYFHARNGTAWTNASYAKDVTLAPGKQARYERALFVGARGDGAAIEAELFYAIAKGTPGGVAFDLVDGNGAALGAGKGLVLAKPERDQSEVAATYFRPAPGDPASLGGELAPGRYTARFEGDGRRSPPIAFEVKPSEIAKVRLVLDGGARLKIAATENGKPVPAKLQIFDAREEFGVAEPQPYRFPTSEPEHALKGVAEIGVARGRYRVVASRGPEYAIAEATVEVAEGATVEVPLDLRRVVATPGYVACDFHQHTALSADSGVGVAERVLSNAVEGVECAVASEHNAVVDFGAVVEELGLGAFFRSIPGDEITADASRVPFGHANVFPLVPDAKDARGGAVPVRDRTAHEVFESVRALPGRPIIQVNHPRAGNRIGYFEELHFDPARGVGRGDGYDAGFDALEVWSGRHAKERDQVLADFWALLRTGHPVTPTANTDTHGIVKQEAGYPRTYVRVADDDPARLDVASLIEGVRTKRDVIITNGPFISVSGDDVALGAQVSLGARPREWKVRVEHAPWVSVTDFTVIADGRSSSLFALGPGRPTASGAIAHDVRVFVKRGVGNGLPRFEPRPGAVVATVGRDTAIAFTARGHRPLEPVLSGDPAEISPFAMTAPIFVDVDGDGRWSPIP